MQETTYRPVACVIQKTDHSIAFNRADAGLEANEKLLTRMTGKSLRRAIEKIEIFYLKAEVIMTVKNSTHSGKREQGALCSPG